MYRTLLKTDYGLGDTVRCRPQGVETEGATGQQRPTCSRELSDALFLFDSTGRRPVSFHARRSADPGSGGARRASRSLDCVQRELAGLRSIHAHRLGTILLPISNTSPPAVRETERVSAMSTVIRLTGTKKTESKSKPKAKVKSPGRKSSLPKPKKTDSGLFSDCKSLFAVVVTKADGTVELKQPFLRPVQAMKYAAGWNSSQASWGHFAEAIEIDLSSIRLTGRVLGQADILPVSGDEPETKTN